jgi:hypothetical protein
MAYPKLPITVTLTDFKVLATDTPRFCAATTAVIPGSAVGNGHPSRPHQIQVKGKKKPVDLVFTIVNGLAGSTDVFWPAGIAFVGAPGNTDPTGGYNFAKATCAGPVLTVTDRNTTHGPGAAAPRWEAYLTVVRLSDLALGVIDPGIENSDDAVAVAAYGAEQPQPTSARRKKS